MKKIFAYVIALVMALTMLAGCGGNAQPEATTSAQELPASALEILETVWANYADEEKFPVIGGNIEANIMDAPGNYDMAYAENMTWNLLVPEDQIANIDEAATMIHMMNANTFTSGVVHLVEGTDAEAFANTMRDAIQNNQWMCGFPETLTVAVVEGGYVLIAFGVNDAMNPFMNHFGEAYPEANILFNEAVAG